MPAKLHAHWTQTFNGDLAALLWVRVAVEHGRVECGSSIPIPHRVGSAAGREYLVRNAEEPAGHCGHGVLFLGKLFKGFAIALGAAVHGSKHWVFQFKNVDVNRAQGCESSTFFRLRHRLSCPAGLVDEA